MNNVTHAKKKTGASAKREATTSREREGTVTAAKKSVTAAKKQAIAKKKPAAPGVRGGTRPRAAQPTSTRTLRGAHYADKHAATASAVERAITRAVATLRKATKGQDLYAFALYTSGTSRFGYVMISANTEAGLDETARAYLKRTPGSTLERERAALRWSPCDWKHHAFAKVPGVKLGALLAIRSAAEDAAIWDAFALALERCDRAGLFGAGEARDRVALAILCGDMDARFLMKGVRRLNPPRIVARVQREWRAGAPAPR